VTRENGQGAAQRETGSGLGAVGRGASERVSAENKPNGVLIRVAAHGLGVSGWDSSAAFCAVFAFAFAFALIASPVCLFASPLLLSTFYCSELKIWTPQQQPAMPCLPCDA
jgi:hypothetical protein